MELPTDRTWWSAKRSGSRVWAKLGGRFPRAAYVGVGIAGVVVLMALAYLVFRPGGPAVKRPGQVERAGAGAAVGPGTTSPRAGPRGESSGGTETQRSGDDQLIAAVQRGDLADATRLVAQGANANARQPGRGGTAELSALHLAAQRGDTALVDLLLAKGADAKATTPGTRTTPLHLAARAEVAERLLAHGADLEARSGEGLTPLHMAAKGNRLDVVQALLQHGATRVVRDQSGQTPLDYALKWGAAPSLVASLRAADGVGSRPRGNTPTTAGGRPVATRALEPSDLAGYWETDIHPLIEFDLQRDRITGGYLQIQDEKQRKTLARVLSGSVDAGQAQFTWRCGSLEGSGVVRKENDGTLMLGLQNDRLSSPYRYGVLPRANVSEERRWYAMRHRAPAVGSRQDKSVARLILVVDGVPDDAPASIEVTPSPVNQESKGAVTTLYYSSGTQVDLTAPEVPGRRFSHWVGVDRRVGAKAALTIKGDQLVKAYYIPVEPPASTPGSPP